VAHERLGAAKGLLWQEFGLIDGPNSICCSSAGENAEILESLPFKLSWLVQAFELTPQKDSVVLSS
jgi:hypothetical protein